MKIITAVILLIFFIFRNSFTLLKGKRDKSHVTLLIYFGRKLIEIVIFFIIPVLLLLKMIEINIYEPLYYLGLLLSVIGLFLMMWTRFYRDKDWGFMGDTPEKDLFTSGPYKITRHPYYMGAIFVGIGIYLQLNYYLVILMLPVILFVIYVIHTEDDFLYNKFGAKFEEYKKKVGVFPWFH